MSTDREVEEFLEGARSLGFLDDARAAECREIARVLRDVDAGLSIDEVAVRKGFLDQKQADKVKRSVASRRIGPYEVLEKLGAGAMGIVWRARDTENDRVVALKVLSRKAATKPAVRQRFQREARVAMKLDHPNIVRGFAQGEEAGYTFLALEFVPGETLAEVIERRERLPEEEAFAVAAQVVSALQHLGAYKLVHRDIKPENLILSAEGPAKLCDLGLTRPALLEAKELGVEEEAIGTPTYVSPEQIQRPDHIDWRADVYSLGCTLYHAITGSPPFKAKTASELTKMQVETPPRDPREHVLDLSEGAATVVLKMLHKDPEGRYASLADLAEDIASVRAGETPKHVLSAAPVKPSKAPRAVAARGADGPRPTAVRSSARPKKKSPVGGIVAALLVLGVIGGGAAVFLNKGKGDAPAETGGGETNTATTAGPEGDPAGGSAEDPVTDVTPDGPDPDATDPDAPPEDFEARQAMDLALAYRRDNPLEYGQIRTRLEFVLNRYRGTPVGDEAETILAAVETERGRAAKQELATRKVDADRSVAEGDLHAAWNRYREFPLVYDGTDAAKQAVEAVDALAKQAEASVSTAETDVKELLADFRFDDAAAAVANLSGCRLPKLAGRIDDLGVAVSSARDTYLSDRKSRRPQVGALAAEVLQAAAEGRAQDGAAAVAEKRLGLNAYRAELEQLMAAQDAVTRVLDAARGAWDARKGNNASLRVPSRSTQPLSGKSAGVNGTDLRLDTASGPVDVPVHAVDVRDVTELVRGGLDPKKPADVRALAAFAMGVGALDAAAAQVKAIELLGPDAAEQHASARWLLAVVREAFVARAATTLEAGRLALGQDRAAEALEAAKKALQVLPGHGPALVLLGRAQVATGKGKDAVASFREALAAEDAPDDARVWLAIGLDAAGEGDAAVKELEGFLATVHRNSPHRETARLELSRIQAKLRAEVVENMGKAAQRAFRRKKWDEAQPAYERILEVDPDNADALLHLGICHVRQNHVFPGFKALTRFVRKHPDHKEVSDAMKELAALEKYEAVSREERTNVQKANVLLAQKKPIEALEILDRALIYSPFYEAARRGRTKALKQIYESTTQKSDLQQWVGAVDDVLVLFPDDNDARLEEAQGAFALGQLERAARSAEAVLAADKASAAPALLAGEIRLAQGDLGRAEDHFQEAHRRTPSAAALLGQALVDERGEYYDAALRKLEQARDGFEIAGPLKDDIDKTIKRVTAAKEARE